MALCSRLKQAKLFQIVVQTNVSSNNISARWKSGRGAVLPSITVTVNGDLIGPPDPISNLRSVTFNQPVQETRLQTMFRMERQAVHQWNQQFWTRHNEKFQLERDAFIKQLDRQLEAASSEASHCGSIVKSEKALADPNYKTDQISVFYKSFLDKHWHTHLEYNYEWYKRNLHLLLLAVSVKVENFRNRWN